MLNVKPEGFLMGHMDAHKYTYTQIPYQWTFSSLTALRSAAGYL